MVWAGDAMQREALFLIHKKILMITSQLEKKVEEKEVVSSDQTVFSEAIRLVYLAVFLITIQN